MNLELLATQNYVLEIKQKVERLMKEHENDIDLMIKVANGDFCYLAHEEFCKEKALGLYDKLNIKIPSYDF